MNNVLFVNVFGYGHINPTLSIVRELINRGEKVTYIAGEEFKEIIQELGAEFVGYKNFDELEFKNGDISLEEIEPQLLGITRLYRDIIDIIFNLKEKFDYIIYDSLFFLANEVGRVLKIPTISSNTTFATNDKSDYLSAFINMLKPVIEKLFCVPEFINTINFLWDKYKIKVPDLFTLRTLKNDLNIVYTSRYFQYYGDSFDDSYKFVGPSISDRNEEIESAFNINEKKKVIYISLGTIFNKSIDFYENCFKAFGDMDVKVIMSVGKNIDINTLKDAPANFFIRSYVPQLEVLKHTDVFITHGGMNSTNEGLYYSVPLIVVPQFFDQPVVANRVAELGAGIAIRKEEATPELLKQSVMSILFEKKFKMNSEKIGKSLREAGGYMRGVDEILNVKNRVLITV